MQIIEDCKTAIKSPPESPIESRILHSRIRAYWSRCEYMLWNAIGVALLYLFQDSLLNEYLSTNRYHLNIIFHSIQFLSIVAYLFTSLADPGYVSLDKSTQLNNEEQQQLILDVSDNEQPQQQQQHVQTSYTRPVEKRYILVENGANTKHKQFTVTDVLPDYNRNILIDRDNEDAWPSNYCDQCHFLRPIRCKHCFFCGKCIAKFDHHCPLVGNCIGGRNYKYFLVFLFTQCLVVLWTFYISVNVVFVSNVKTNDEDHTVSYKHTAVGWIFRILFFVVMFMFLFSIIGLTGFHMYLLATNQTTMELMRPDSIDRYLFDEMKRKKEYEKKQRKNKQVLNGQNDEDEEKVQPQAEEEKKENKDNAQVAHGHQKTDSGDYQYRFYGNVTSYRTYFDEGFCGNLRLIMRGVLKPEWVTPIQCRFRRNDKAYVKEP